MKILAAHNHYQHAGGEDTVFSNEVALLKEAGHVVDTLEVSNDSIVGPFDQIAAATGSVYSRSGRNLLSNTIRRFEPDVVHVHNFFPKLSPSIFDACKAAHVPTVWTLHNFRVTCANGLLFRNNKPCVDCLGQFPVSAIRHRCYRNSLAGSVAVAGMIEWHRALGTWDSKVTRFIALTDFARDIFIRAGLPEHRIVVKPNFVPDPYSADTGPSRHRRGVLFVGRLSREKGLDTLVQAWKFIDEVPLTIIGDGPERLTLQNAAPPNVFFAGHKDAQGVQAAMAHAQALVVPSIWYENFPMTIVEAMASGTPVIASRIGALASLVSNDRTGLHFEPGQPDDLARVVKGALSNPENLNRLGENARLEWRKRMSPGANLECLLGIYESAIHEQTFDAHERL